MPDAAPPQETLLELNNIEVIYNHVILVLKGVSLRVPKGGITALLGGNGAGKTTTLKAVSNLLHSERGEVTKGTITYRGDRIQAMAPADLVKRGVIQVMEGRHCFEHLTVEENLLTGAYTRGSSRRIVSGRLLRARPRATICCSRIVAAARPAIPRAASSRWSRSVVR
jgi:branched-chain amino acid transport system ATP-binding protein